MMTIDEQRYIVVAKREGKVVATRACTGTHRLPIAMAAVALKYLGVAIAFHKVTLRLVKTEPDAADVASGGGA